MHGCRSKTTRRFALPAAVTMAIALIAASLAAVAPASPDDRLLGLPDGDSILFAVRADSGSLNTRSGSKESFKLVLRHVERRSVWFSDRPNRDSGLLATKRLFSKWSELGFVADPPNAALALEFADEDADTVPLELGKPRFDRGSRSVRMRVDVLDGPSSGLAHLIEELDDHVGDRFDDATLFIDNASAGSSGCTIGEIDYFAAPKSFRSGAGFANVLEADGRTLEIRDHLDLFEVIGTRFGGDGQTTFALPKVDPLDGGGVIPTICAEGDLPQGAPDSCLMGTVQLSVVTSEPPAGYLPADGRLIRTGDNLALFALLGYTFGGNQGEETFALPNLPAPEGLVNLVCVEGVFWGPGQTPPESCFLTGTDLFATTQLPGNYLPADGRELKIAENPLLDYLMSNSFGGDGKQTFALPNLASPHPGMTWGVCAGNDGAGAVFPSPGD